MLLSIKRWSYNRRLKERQTRIKESKKEPLNYGKKICILYEITDLDDHSVVKSIKQDLSSHGILVKTLSYIDQKIEINSLAQKTFSKKEIQWNGISSSPYVDEFLDWDPDLLICPLKTMRDCYKYIITLSSAKLKIGLNTTDAENLYDIIIDSNPDLQFSDTLDEILKHLKIISN